MKYEPKQLDSNVNVPPTSHFKDFLKFTCWLLLIGIGTYAVLGFAAEHIAGHLPAKYEQAIGKLFTSNLKDVDFPQTRRYVQTITDRLVAHTKDLPSFCYTVHIHPDSVVNAVALPAGHIVVYAGLLRQLKSENELAMVLAHELGHYAHRDQLRGLGRGLVFLSVSAVLGLSGNTFNLFSPIAQSAELKFSRDQEAAADLYGLDLLVRTYGHAAGAMEVYNILARQHEGKMKVPEVLQTHPDDLWRKEQLQGRIRSRNYPLLRQMALPEKGKLPFSIDLPVNKLNQAKKD